MEHLDAQITPELDGQTLAAALRCLIPEMTWSHAKRLIVARHVCVNGTLCLNDARRLKAGERLTVSPHPAAPLPRETDVRLLHIDPDLVVVEKPPGVQTLRRDEEADFSPQRKDLAPTLDELVGRMLPGQRPSRPRKGRPRPPAPPPVYAVHRLDRDTSGLMLFALSVRGRDELIRQFSAHQVNRTYVAVVHGIVEQPRTFRTHLARNRGDGLRGSVPESTPDARLAITHIRPIELIRTSYTILECRLETGRTHQIRIHLAEAGHMLCGEKVYLRPSAGAEAVQDKSAAPRQALHSSDLRLIHPFTGRELHFSSPLPRDLQTWLDRLRTGAT